MSSTLDTFDIKTIYEALGPEKCAGLPGFHAFTGADITGSFYKKGKKLNGRFITKGIWI